MLKWLSFAQLQCLPDFSCLMPKQYSPIWEGLLCANSSEVREGYTAVKSRSQKNIVISCGMFVEIDKRTDRTVFIKLVGIHIELVRT